MALAVTTDTEWPEIREVKFRGAQPNRGKGPRLGWQPGITSGCSPQSALNVTWLNLFITKCGREGCGALVAIQKVQQSAAAAARADGSIEPSDGCHARGCILARCSAAGCPPPAFQAKRHIMAQLNRIDKIMSGEVELIHRPSLRSESKSHTLPAAAVAAAITAAAGAAIAELPRVKSNLDDLDLLLA